MGATRLASGKYYAFYTLHFAMHVLPVKMVMPPGHHSYEGADLLLEQQNFRPPLPAQHTTQAHLHNLANRADKCRQACKQVQTSVQTESASVYTSFLYDFHALKSKSAECRQNDFEMPMRTRTRA